MHLTLSTTDNSTFRVTSATRYHKPIMLKCVSDWRVYAGGTRRHTNREDSPALSAPSMKHSRFGSSGLRKNDVGMRYLHCFERLRQVRSV